MNRILQDIYNYIDKNSDVGNTALTSAGGILGSAIGGNMQSGAGNTLQGLSSLAQAIPGPWGTIASTGLNVVGGLTNRLFGSSLNQANINAVQNKIDTLNSLQSDTGSFDTLADTWSNTSFGGNFSDSYIGKDGLFSNKAKKKARALREQMYLANQYAFNTLQNNADNITENTMNNLEATYAALGGLLHQYGDGGGIHINPANKGKFNATKKRTGKTTEELTHSKNPLTRKRAIFAQNAAKWNHAFGGELNTHGGDFSTGLSFINDGGSHENNPYGGIMMGIAPDGNPNLVEEGEVVYNNYVFSNRLTVPKAVREKYNLKDKMTYAEAVKKLTKEDTERPNDPISKDTLQDVMADLAGSQEALRIKKEGNMFAKGGDLTKLRFAPVIGQGIMAATDLMGITNKPDYSEAATIEAAARNATYNPVSWNTIGNKLTYRPFDRDYYTNKLNAQSGATRRAIANQSGGNRGRALASLIAADYNAQNQLGDLFRKSEEYNIEQRQRVEDFNRATNQLNAQGLLQADSANQQAQANLRNYTMQGLLSGAEMRQKERLATDQAKANNLSGLYTSLGNVGYEMQNRNTIQSMYDAGYFKGVPEAALLSMYPWIKLKTE